MRRQQRWRTRLDEEADIRIIKQILGNAREWLDRWRARLPNKGQTIENRMARTNCFGMQGSTYKRMGLLYASIKDAHTAEEKLKAALDAYRRGMDEWVTEDARFSWTASQYLALAAVPRSQEDGNDERGCLHRLFAARRTRPAERRSRVESLGTWNPGRARAHQLGLRTVRDRREFQGCRPGALPPHRRPERA